MEPQDDPLEHAARVLSPHGTHRAEAREAVAHLAQAYREHFEADARTPSPSDAADELRQIARLARSLRTALRQANPRVKAALVGAWPLGDAPHPEAWEWLAERGGRLTGWQAFRDSGDPDALEWIETEPTYRAALERLEDRARAAATAVRQAGRGRRRGLHREPFGTPKGQLAHHGAVLFQRFRQNGLSRDPGPFRDFLEGVARVATPDLEAAKGLARAAHDAVPLVKRRWRAARELRMAREAGDTEREGAAQKRLADLDDRLRSL